MVTLYINNTQISQSGNLELDNPKITIKLESKSFKEPSTIKTPYTYSFTAPITATNARLLATPHSPSTYNRSRIPATLTITNPSITYNGYVIVTNCDDINYSLNFYGAEAEIFRLLSYNGEKEMSLADILPSNLRNSTFVLTPEEVIKNSSIAFRAYGSSSPLLYALIAKYGWNNQSKKLTYWRERTNYFGGDNSKVDVVDISSFNSSKGWSVDSITGSYLPWQFGDMRVECMQPVMPLTTIFSWISSYLSSKGYTFSAPSTDYGVALPLFTSLDDGSAAVTSVTVNNNNSFTMPVFASVDFYFPNVASVYRKDLYRIYKIQLGYTIEGPSGNYVVAYYDSNNIKSTFNNYQFIQAEVEDTQEHEGYDTYKYFSISLEPGTYTIRQFYDHSSSGIVRYNDYRSLYPNHSSPTVVSVDLSSCIGRWYGESISPRKLLSKTITSGATVPFVDYFSATKSPLFYLTEYMRMTGKHIVLSGSSVSFADDYSNPTVSSSPTFTDIQVDSIIPQVYEEDSIKFKFESNDDYFSERYNDVYSDTPLGSGTVNIRDTSDVPHDLQSSVSFADCKFKYAPGSHATSDVVYKSSGSINQSFDKFTTIAYDSSGNQIDLVNSVFKLISSAIEPTGIAVSFNSDEGRNVLAYELFKGSNGHGTSSFYRMIIPTATYTIPVSCVHTSSGFVDYVAFGSSKWYSTEVIPDISSESGNYARRVAEHYADGSFSSTSKPQIDYEVGYSAKKIVFTCRVTSSIVPFTVYNVPNIGLVKVLSVSLNIGNSVVTAKVEGLVYTNDPVYAKTLYQITGAASPDGSGSVSGSGLYAKDQSCTLRFTPNTGYVFDSWSNGVTSNPTTFSVARDTVLYANAKLSQYTVTTSVSPSGSGTVTGGGTYSYGETCTLKAEPISSNYTVRWKENGQVIGYYVQYSFTVTSNRTITAEFIEGNYLTLTNTPSNSALVYIDGELVEFGQLLYRRGMAQGESLTITSTPNLEGYTIEGIYKDGVKVTSEANYTVTMATADIQIDVKYTTIAPQNTLTVSNDPAGSSSIYLNGELLEELPYSEVFVEGDEILLNCVPGTGQTFVSWQTARGTVVSTDAQFTYTMPASSMDLVAVCDSRVKVDWTYQSTINCSAYYTANGNPYTFGDLISTGTSITVVASPKDGYFITGWYNGASVLQVSPTQFTLVVNSNYSLQATTTEAAQVNVSIPLSGASVNYTFVAIPSYGTKTISYPGGVVTVPSGSNTTFTVGTLPSPYQFQQWYKNNSTPVATQSVNMYGGTDFALRLDTIKDSYTVRAVADGPGIVHIEQGGSTVSNPYVAPYNTNVDFVAVPNSGYSFSGWYLIDGVTLVSSSATYNFDIHSDVTYYAKFSSTPTYNLSVASSPANTGTFNVTPGTGPQPAGTNYSVTFTPSTGRTFTGWADGTSASVNPRTGTLNADTALVANTAALSYNVTCTVSPSGGGTVTGMGTYNYGATCTLVATPAAGYSRVDWYEGTEYLGSGTSYQILVTSNRSLTAVFGVNPTISLSYNVGSLEYLKKNGSDITIPEPGVVTTIDCVDGDRITAKYVTPTGYVFNGWFEGTEVYTQSVTLEYTVSHSATITANASQSVTYVLDVSNTLPAGVEAMTVLINNDPQEPAATYDVPAGAMVRATVTLNEGYRSDGWYHGTTILSGEHPTYCDFTMPESDYDISAHISLIPRYTISASGDEHSTPYAKVNGVPVDLPYEGEENTVVELNAVTSSGYAPAYWTKGSSSTPVSSDFPYYVTLTENASYVSHAEAATYSGLTFNSATLAKVYLQNTSNTPNLEYSTDTVNWTTFPSAEEAAVEFTGNLYLRGTNTSGFSRSISKYSTFKFLLGSVTVSGDILSLVSPDMSSVSLPTYCFYQLFYQATNITDISNIVLPSFVSSNCYNKMFAYSSAVGQAPALPATTLAIYCYYQMFFSCSGITECELPAATLQQYCYSGMFAYSGIELITCYATNISATNCTSGWVSGVTYEGDFFGYNQSAWEAKPENSGIPTNFYFHSLTLNTSW